MNINYINESVISVAVMRRKAHSHTRTLMRSHAQGQQGEGSMCRMFVVPQQSEAESIAGRLAND